MKETSKRLISLLLALFLVISIVLPADAATSGQKITTTPTGYTKAEDVDYLIVNGTVVNWGARGEDCVFLSAYAIAFYPSGSTYTELSQLDGSNQQAQVPDSELYAALQTLMASKHTNIQTYQNTRPFYCYTDCVSNDHSKLSTFYAGALVNSTWDKGNTYTREHIWPDSKCLSPGRKKNDGADIMTLRPVPQSENSSRSNKAYGESSGYCDPGVSVRGDCARMVLYTYVRWGNTGKMWGFDGVIENLEILLKWAEEDPVDTWEMARNDSVQSITGTRNVFVDYPELAWLLFGQEIPAEMTTPSGSQDVASPSDNTPPATDNTPPATDSTLPATDSTSPAAECTHASTTLVNQKSATCTEIGYTGDEVCSMCGKTLETGTTISAGHKDTDQNMTCDACGANLCTHPESQLQNQITATCQEEGYTGDMVCVTCSQITEQGQPTPKADHSATVIGQIDATCGKDGYSGDTVCSNCNEPIINGTVLPATGNHNYSQWVTEKEATTKEVGLQTRICTECGHKEYQDLPLREASYAWVIVTIVGVIAICTAGVVFFILKRKK